jgi:ATP-dependent exoDNAse (exonuclease V) beta subunit
VDLRLTHLPDMLTVDLKEADRQPTAPPLNEQTAEAFRQEALRLVERSRKIQWIQPSRIEIEELPLPVPPDDELTEAAPEVRGSAVRGKVLHKLMEEILLGETRDEESDLRTRAAELLEQLGEKDHPDPSQGPSSQEISSTIRRTLQLPVVAANREALQPELGVFRLIEREHNVSAGSVGIVDAICYSAEGKPMILFDWKSDVAPKVDGYQHHAAQVKEYLDITGSPRGFVVYMTTGEVREVINHMQPCAESRLQEGQLAFRW